MWCGSGWLDGVMTSLHVWLDGGMTVGMRGDDFSCVGHGGMLGIFILGGEETDGIFGGWEAVGTIRGGGAVGTKKIRGRSGRPYQRVIGGVVG